MEDGKQDSKRRRKRKGKRQRFKPSILPDTSTVNHNASSALETSRENRSSTSDIEVSDSVDEDPDVPPLTRTDSIFLTKEYLYLSRQSNESEVSSCAENTDEYNPSKDLRSESSSDGSNHRSDKLPLKKKKPKPSEKTTESDDVSVMKLKKTKDGGRVYSKKHYCLYCPQQTLKMARHLVRKHSTELAVAKAMSFPLKSKERKLQFDLIRNKGNRAHNNEVLKRGSGTLIPSQQTSKSVTASDYMHCINCEAFLKRKTLWRHMSRCRLAQKCSKQKPGKSRIQSICAFAQPVPDSVSRKVWELVNVMHQDQVTQIVREERSILRLGEDLYAKHGHDRSKHEYIRQKMREMGRLVQHSQREGKLKKIEDFYVPSNFKHVVAAVKDVAGFDEDTNTYKTPSLALKLGHSLKKIADILECEAQMSESDNEHFLENVRRTRSLFEKKWDVLVSSSALQTLKEGKWNKPQLLPFTEDVKKMHIYLDDCRKEYQSALKDDPNKKNWSKLAKVTLCEVILFNRRREGEVSKMPLSAFTLRDTSGTHSDLADGLSELEKNLCQHFQRIEIRGKRNRKVPILLTPDMFSSMEALVTHRRMCGVPDDNPFFFSRPEAETHLRGSDAIREMAKESGAKHPETLSSTKLRKQIATLSTVLNLRDNEMDTLANFLGHDIRVHREYYRLPEGTLQLAKVSKVLIALEQGRLADFKGMSMDQIQIHPQEDVPENPESEVSEAEGDSSLCSSSSGSKRDQPTPDVLSDECAPIRCSTPNRGQQMESENDDLKSEPPPSKRKRQIETDYDEPVTDASTSKKSQQARVHKDVTKSETSTRRSWSKIEIRAVEKTLTHFIESGKVPGKADCVACITASPEALKSRCWTAVKFYVKNRITAIQRESARRIY